MAKITFEGGQRFRPGRTAIPRAQQQGRAFGSAGAGLGTLAGALANVGEDALRKRDRAIDVDYIADSNVKAQAQIQQIRTDMVNTRKDFKGFSDDFIEQADKVYNEFIDNAPSEASRQSLKSAFAGQRIGQYRAAFDVENKAIADNVLSNATENVNIISNTIHDNPGSLINGLDQIGPVVEAVDEVLDETNKQRFIEQSRKEVGNSYITGLINSDRLEEANKAIDSDEVKQIFSSDERNAYKRAVTARASSNLKKMKDNREAEINSINDTFLQREMGNELIVSDIMESNLPAIGPKSKDFWLKRLEKAETSAVGNARLYNTVYDKVDDMTEDDIFELADPTNITNNGRPLNMDQVESLLKAKRGEVDETMKTYFSGFKATITGSNALGLKDPRGDQQFMKMKFEAEAMLKRAKEKGNRETGLTARDMFDPLSPRFEEFGGLLVSKYKRSQKDIMNSLTEDMGVVDERGTRKSPDQILEEYFKGE